MTGRCVIAPPSPLADRAGYVPRCPSKYTGPWWWGLWCCRQCVLCGEHTGNDNLRCRECDIDVLQGVVPEERYDARFAAATTPHGVCARRAAREQGRALRVVAVEGKGAKR